MTSLLQAQADVAFRQRRTRACTHHRWVQGVGEVLSTWQLPDWPVDPSGFEVACDAPEAQEWTDELAVANNTADQVALAQARASIRPPRDQAALRA